MTVSLNPRVVARVSYLLYPVTGSVEARPHPTKALPEVPRLGLLEDVRKEFHAGAPKAHGASESFLIA